MKLILFMPGGQIKPVKDKNTPKRKVISPLSTDITHPNAKGGKTGSSGQTNTRTKQNEVSKQQKRFHSSTGYFNFDYKVSDAFSVNTMTQT